MKVKLLCSVRNIPSNLFDDKNVDWIGVDRGTLELVNNQIKPVSAVGDFDSVNEQELEQIRKAIDVYPVKKEKDDTDLALAVNLAVDMGYTEIEIYGATGGRLDHYMGAVQILTKPEFLKQDFKISLIDQQNHISVLKPGKHEIFRVEDMTYVSFVPLNTGIRIKLDELKYELPFTTLDQGSTLTISNEFKEGLERGFVQVELGNVLIIQSKDI
ncbi:thiamine diphosphokinase [Mammaliicoccus lentus]|uniref:Thiamine diphosphokinase n=1 Tax=Mammaliicoccus lentus TaxID=42858 RepID=A0AAX3W822_MAMLE|nr:MULTISPECIES: thiamine diphosphokinase [Mammaliicoccus]HBV04239.1 thiamine diphosphokinase [Staphylococcus sp.]MBF0793886.1 thiamine diphosphokinase [Mammaliicoccus lentus]MBW0761254.1 thiamine diphosphokinase [Mammaliicoccus lentus]MBW0768191.1 thiamine diphosphokinase [Mammaliicoccus lentus]MBW0770580.1 thiamine diphosphokinase [Mammaliicoccus lentus]